MPRSGADVPRCSRKRCLLRGCEGRASVSRNLFSLSLSLGFLKHHIGFAGFRIAKAIQPPESLEKMIGLRETGYHALAGEVDADFAS